MTMRILLVGMNSFDSGKTQVAIQLGEILSGMGYAVEYFKPLSAHNYWYHYEHTKICLEKRILASMDAMKVRGFLDPKSPIELANPVHRLYVPMRLEKPMENIMNTLGLAGADSILAMERLSRPDKSNIDSTILLAESVLEEDRLIIDQEEIGKLTRNAAILAVNNLEEVHEFERMNFENHVSDSFSEVERSGDVVVIEGFNDAAWPWNGLEQVDAVLLCSPAHIFSYDPERFRKAAYLMNRRNLPIREVTFGRISDLLKPIGRLELRLGGKISIDDLGTLSNSFRTGKND